MEGTSLFQSVEDCVLDDVMVIRMDTLPKGAGGSLECAGSQAEQDRGIFRPVNGVGDDIPFPRTDVASPESLPTALSPRPPPHFLKRALRNIAPDSLKFDGIPSAS